MAAFGPGRLRKNSPVLTSTILDPSPGLDARARFEAAAQGGGISPLRSPHQAHTAAHTLSLTQEACPCRGEAVHGQRPMRGAAARTLEREPWTVSLSKASKLLAKVATIQGYHFELRASQPDRLEPSNSSHACLQTNASLKTPDASNGLPTPSSALGGRQSACLKCSGRQSPP
ncbi:hypothetical protein NA56DRAFT_711265 [Hyaloscypha hepaticicola]|uniref:Uncharacterized protein n=1 Tax=Hyaloscypha hepaticicola TaxID=2082293 RepID=A0A2J6PJG3_9HELO|nr:hypothetical protein NA56DRAFT_711265 [Hyaloscypha hepaticicola]